MEQHNNSRPASKMLHIAKSSGERLWCSTVLFCNMRILRFAQDGRRRIKQCDPALFAMMI